MDSKIEESGKKELCLGPIILCFWDDFSYIKDANQRALLVANCVNDFLSAENDNKLSNKEFS